MDQSLIRNFSVIAHVDHGKSTLSDRLMELTGTVEKRQMHDQLLDSNPIERERGVTIKLAPVTMKFQMMNDELQMTNAIQHSTFYILNLIDTPGHVDFSYEVERSLAACEGAILLVDATQGIQAQTLAHAQKAAELGLTIIPALNKVDLATAQVDTVLTELKDVFGYQPDEVSLISAKTGQGVPELISRIIKEIPAPAGKDDQPLRALIFNSSFDHHLGVVAFVRVVDGQLNNQDKLISLSNLIEITPKEVGIFTPNRTPTNLLATGQVGYIATGLKDIRQVRVGDTLTQLTTNNKQQTTPLPGYRQPKPMVFADVYPGEDLEYQQFVESVGKLKLSDASLTTKPIHSSVLGPGLRLGFLGLFHVEITKERLLREQYIDTIFTLPTVAYTVLTASGKTLLIQSPNDLPDPSSIQQIDEPMTKTTIFTPAEFIGQLMQTIESRRGEYQNTIYMGTRAQLTYKIPLAELISGMFDSVKSVSRGFATIDYELIDPRAVDAVKLTMLVNHQPVESLARIVVREKARQIGIKMVEILKELMPPQQFAVPIQAAIGSEIVARETKKAVRKDVTAKLYGGDQTRKDKLLKKQKKGKKKMARIGQVNLPDEILTRFSRLAG